MLKIMLILLAIVTLINIITYTRFRLQMNGRARLEVRKPAKEGEKMTYCLPGMKSDPENAFKFIENTAFTERNLINGGITYVYYEDSGFYPKAIARQIVADVKKHHYTPYIISVSVGDQIARHVEAELENLSIIAINPATNRDCLSLDYRIKLRFKLFFENIILFFAGWIGQLRLIKLSGNKRQSLALYNDMKNYLAKSKLAIGNTATKVVVFSYYDNILDNISVYNQFSRVTDIEGILIDTEHANLSIGGILYRDKLSKIIENIYKTPSKNLDA